MEKKIFKNPPKEFRGAPFWAWNTKLDKEVLKRQIGYLKEMGFGGFHIHSRSGMATPYLGSEWFDLVKTCMDKAEKEDMIPYFYDEDRWPSGAAGGLVTKDKRLLQRVLVFTPEAIEAVDKETAVKEGKTYFVCAYDIKLDKNGCLMASRRIGLEDKAEGDKWYAYSKTTPQKSWFNYEGYADTLSKEAIDRFIEITYDGYKNNLGDRLAEGRSFFTDEPQLGEKETLADGLEKRAVTLPWTVKFDEFFNCFSGLDIYDVIPQLIWELPNGEMSYARYCFHNAVSELFTESFADNCGDWCKKNGMQLTGHVLGEGSLFEQTRGVGEAMRCYRNFGMPGVDILSGAKEYSSIKQAQSVARQYGKKGVTSELYGVTGWDFDFKGHKEQGDWQAALGVTFRVPHLAWVSMEGSGKRDYPASINYQSPWYKEYKYIEDHFARVNYALSGGKPICRVGVIHPIESYWLLWGPNKDTFLKRKYLDDSFAKTTETLLKSQIDFDFISEALLEDIYEPTKDKTFKAGKMEYDAIVIPPMITMRPNTFKALYEFAEKGGKIIVVSEGAKYVDVRENGKLEKLYGMCEKVGEPGEELSNKLSCVRFLKVDNKNGIAADNFVYNAVEKDGGKYVFLSQTDVYEDREKWQPKKPYKYISSRQDIVITINEPCIPTLLNTLTREEEIPDYETKDGKTYIYRSVYASDSILLSLKPGEGKNRVEKKEKSPVRTITFTEPVRCRREEDNVVVLDTANWALNNGEYSKDKEYVLNVDTKAREILKIDTESIWAQPWVLPDSHKGNIVKLKFSVWAKERIKNVKIALENIEGVKVFLNSNEVKLRKNGYYVDEAIKTARLGTLKKGENIIEAYVPVSMRQTVEPMYIIGDFYAELAGTRTCLKRNEKFLPFDETSRTGMPFYGGNIEYTAAFETDGEYTAVVSDNMVFGATAKIYVDGEDLGHIAFAPFRTKEFKLKPGKHTLKVKYFGTRVNTFGFLHNTNEEFFFHVPQIFYTQGEEFTYNYMMKRQGVLKAPVIELY